MDDDRQLLEAAARAAGIADLLEVAGPQNWLLIDPQGRVWSGRDPMVLAVHANYEPLGTGAQDE